MSSSIKLSTGFVPALLLLWSGAAVAEDVSDQCTEDTDCAEGYFCAKGASSPGCDAVGECPEPDVVEEEFGSCELAPVSCTSDADCDEYLSCVDVGTSNCTVSSDGTSSCDDGAPDAVMQCSVATIECRVDADCPREFECVSHAAPCPAIDCAEDAPDCKPCEPNTRQVCQPKQIACVDDDDCPSDWSCAYVSEGGGGDVAEPAPIEPQPTEPAPEPAMDLPGTRTSSEDGPPNGACYPNALGGDGYVTEDEAGGAAEPGSAEDSASGGPETSSGGGCSVGAVGASGAAGWLMTLLLVAPLAWRRKRS